MSDNASDHEAHRKFEHTQQGQDWPKTNRLPAVLVATVQALVRTRIAEDAMRHSETKFKAHEQVIAVDSVRSYTRSACSLIRGTPSES
jgi:hypothetical protein